MKQARKTKKIRILIADREEVFRLGVRKLFALEDDLRVVAQAATGEQAVSLAERFTPHVVMIQGELAGEPPGNLLDQLRRVSPRSKLVITTSALRGESASHFIKAGAAGVILRSAAVSQFAKTVREAMKHKTVLMGETGNGRARTGEAPPAPAPPLRPVDTLTQREKAVIGCLMQGFPNRDIAQRLAIAEQTVKNHLRSIFDKVGVSDRLELVLYAIHQQIEIPMIKATRSGPPEPAASR